MPPTEGGRDRKVPQVGTLRVCLDARLRDGVQGGVQQTVIGLTTGLAELDDGPEEYSFLVEGESPSWLRPFLGDRFKAIECKSPVVAVGRTWKEALRGALRRPPFTGAWDWARSWLPMAVPASDGTIERARIDVMHLTIQAGFLTTVPTIYCPQDLQHVHLPQMFSRADRVLKALSYKALCDQASAVVAQSSWGKQDLVRSLGLPEDKIHIVPWAPAVDAYRVPSETELRETRARLALPEAFAYYPAQTWRHKNHLALLEAIALLRDRDGIEVPVVFTGHRNAFHETIDRKVRQLNLQGQVRFLGYVDPAEVQALYMLSRMLVFPSLFEGFGLPVVEAFRRGVAVACSTATCLPEIAGGAAELFDPRSVGDMARAIQRVWCDPDLRSRLVERGQARGSALTWRGTAARYRALYRLVAGRRLDDSDRILLGQMAQGSSE